MYRNPWERQEGEGASAFYAFALYRDQGHKRSTRAVCERLASEADDGVENADTGAEPGKEAGFSLTVRPKGWKPDEQGANRARKNATGHVRNWYKVWNWSQRALAWDDELDRQIRKAQVDEAQEMARIQAREARACVAVNMAVAGLFLKGTQDPGNKVRLEKIAIEDLMFAAMDASRNIPKLHEAERNARCIRLRDMLREDGSVVTQWEYFERRPDRDDPELESAIEENREPL